MKEKKSYVIGYDLGGTKILAVLFDSRFKPVSEVKTKTKPQKGERFFLKTLQKCFDEVLHQGGVKRSEVIGIGAGCPGLIDERRGIVKASPNLGFMANFPLASRLQRLCGLPVVVGNDVNTGLFGEYQFGAARGYSHVIGIFVGTGIGGALIINGQLYPGATGGAGEIGHIQIDPLGPTCGCGRRGCFEAFCSRLAIASEAAVLAVKQKAPHLLRSAGTDIRDIKSGELAKAIRAGDRAIEDLVLRKSVRMGAVLASLVHILNRQIIVLGGGVVEAMPTLIVKEATRAMLRESMPAVSRDVKVIAAQLGDHAIVMGAAKMAWDRFKE
jgi:glucokinase